MPEQSTDPTPHSGPTADTRDFFSPEVGPAGATIAYADAEVREADILAVLDPEDARVVPRRVKKKLGIVFWVALGWMILIVGLALAAPFITKGNSHEIVGILDDPTAGISSGQNVQIDQPIGTPGHPLGTDALGRDLLSRTIWGARPSLTVGVFSILLGLVVGGFIGLVAGYYRGFTESGLMAGMDVLLAYPPLILALAIITFTGQRTLWVITLAIGIVGIAPLARLIRANTLVYGQREFVTAAQTMGAKRSRIIRREIVPNVSRAVSSFAIIGIAVAITAEGGLAFLGLSLPPPTPTWGTMINEGRTNLQTAPWETMVPATALFLTVMALNFAGDRVRQYFDVREGGL
jgi:peptide/nickel transport system permease protein